MNSMHIHVILMNLLKNTANELKSSAFILILVISWSGVGKT